MTANQDETNLRVFTNNIMLRDFPDMDADVAFQFINKAYDARVFATTSNSDMGDWYQDHFKPYVFLLDENEYTQATIQALRIQFLIAGTDFGSSRQRDLGQKWSDTIRGYLGELGVKQVLQKKFGVEISLGHEPGTLEEFLSLDIHKVKLPNEPALRAPKLNVSIKTAKSNGIWLDIPGDQFNHSDLYVLALIGVGVDHLFSFFKHLSVFKDKVLKKGLDNNCINQLEADEIYNKVPSFKSVYGYIPGLVTSNTNLNDYTFEGRMGLKNYLISNWSGKYETEFLETIRDQYGAKKVGFEGIGQFSQSNRYIFGLKSLKYSDADWNNFLINRI